MFLVGAHCRKYPALVREIQTCGHQIGVHGDTHRSHLLYTPAQVRNSARNSIHAIADAGASSLQLFRPPYGHLNPLTQRALAQVGMRGMLWSLILNDWRPQPLQPMLSKVRMSIEDGTILVLHDSPCATNNILPLLPELAPLATAAALNFTQITPADLAQ
jgi:peptidoglycan/xylan/chitin deacetylase (PgdA/CDA1 family)